MNSMLKEEKFSNSEYALYHVTYKFAPEWIYQTNFAYRQKCVFYTVSHSMQVCI